MTFRTASFFIIAVLAIGLAYVGYRLMDLSISYSYASSGEDEANADNRRFRRLLLEAWRGMDRSRVITLLQKDAKAHPEEKIFIKEDGRAIWYEDYDFRFSEKGTLEGIGQGVGVPSPKACGGAEAPSAEPCTAP